MSSPSRVLLPTAACMVLSCALAYADPFEPFDAGGRRRLRIDAEVSAESFFGGPGTAAPGRLDLLRTGPSPSAFERSFVVKIAKVFIDKVQVAEVAGLRIRFKIILE